MFQFPTTLLVENNRSIHRSQAALLRDLGYREVVVSENGAEGWALIKKLKIGLVISAWHLGLDMSGLGLLRVVRADEAYKNIPFVLVADEITKIQVMGSRRGWSVRHSHTALHPEKHSRKKLNGPCPFLKLLRAGKLECSWRRGDPFLKEANMKKP